MALYEQIRSYTNSTVEIASSFKSRSNVLHTNYASDLFFSPPLC